MNKHLKAEAINDHRCWLGEGPLWDHNTNRLYWTDIPAKEIGEYEPETGSFRIIPVEDTVGAIGLYDSEKMIAAAREGFVFLSKKDGEIHFIKRPEDAMPGTRFNDGKVDPRGRFFAGTMSLKGEKNRGSLFTLETDLTVSMQVEGVSVSNGLCWSPDLRSFYYVDTPTYQVACFDYDKATGRISNRKVAINIPLPDGAPDGMTIDEEGKLWIAHWDGGQLTRWDPSTGQKLLSIPFPVSRITSCIFGGAQLNDLYVTTASAGLSDQHIQQQPLAGALFIIRNCGYKGMKTFTFRNNNINNEASL